jgi:hypothetical protein
VQYHETDDQAAHRYARRPVGVYVERVYDSVGFSALRIGE